MPVILHGSPFSTFTWSARLALAEKGVEYTIQGVDLRSDDYGKMHPWRRMPVLDHDGFRVFESAAVMRYVDEAFPGPALQPADPAGRARMTQWLSAFADNVAIPAVRGVLIPRYVLAPRGIPFDEAKVAVRAAEAHGSLRHFDATLSSSPYLAGAEPSLADWMLLPVMASGGGLTGADRYTDGLPALDAWMVRMTARPSFAATLPH